MNGRFGIIGVFETPNGIKDAAGELRRLGFRGIEAYTPYPVKGLGELIHPGRKPGPPLVMFGAAILGASWGYFIQYWDEALDYPINVGGRPHNSWPAFIVGDFEFMLLATVFAGLVALLLWSRLPKLYDPRFAPESFERASRDRFLLCVEAAEPGFDPVLLRRVLERCGAQVEEVVA